MSFKRFDAEDLVASAEPVTAPLWTGNSLTLTSFYTGSQKDGTSGDYYLEVYQTGSTLAAAETQFSIAYCDKVGSGSNAYNTAVVGNSPSRTNYGQYRSLVLGDEETDFLFGGVAQDYFYAINIDRNRYKEKLLPGTLNLTVGSLQLTDSSKDTTTLSFNLSLIHI